MKKKKKTCTVSAHHVINNIKKVETRVIVAWACGPAAHAKKHVTLGDSELRDTLYLSE